MDHRLSRANPGSCQSIVENVPLLGNFFLLELLRFSAAAPFVGEEKADVGRNHSSSDIGTA